MEKQGYIRLIIDTLNYLQSPINKGKIKTVNFIQ